MQQSDNSTANSTSTFNQTQCVEELNAVMSAENLLKDTTGTAVSFVQDFCVEKANFFPSKSQLNNTLMINRAQLLKFIIKILCAFAFLKIIFAHYYLNSYHLFKNRNCCALLLSL
jgi:hypothetical protein